MFRSSDDDGWWIGYRFYWLIPRRASTNNVTLYTFDRVVESIDLVWLTPPPQPLSPRPKSENNEGGSNVGHFMDLFAGSHLIGT